MSQVQGKFKSLPHSLDDSRLKQIPSQILISSLMTIIFSTISELTLSTCIFNCDTSQKVKSA